MKDSVELKKFYEYKNKLLVASKYFMGFNPVISSPLKMPSGNNSDELVIRQDFEIGNENFHSVFSTSPTSIKDRELKRMEIYKGDNRIIAIRKRTFGSKTTTRGRNFYLEGDKACLLISGALIKDFQDILSYGIIIAENYYLLVFSNITVPKTFPFRKIRPKRRLPSNQKHIATKVKLWEGILNTEEGEITGVASTLVGLGSWWDERFNSPKPKGHIEFYINGQPYFFENI